MNPALATVPAMAYAVTRRISDIPARRYPKGCCRNTTAFHANNSHTRDVAGRSVFPPTQSAMMGRAKNVPTAIGATEKSTVALSDFTSVFLIQANSERPAASEYAGQSG